MRPPYALVKSLGGAFISGLLAFAGLEIALRIYNPIDLPIRGTDIILPIGKKLILEHHEESTKIESEALLAYNSLGFRGPDPPADFGRALTVVAVGGSTTESIRQTDGKDWPALVSARLTERFDDVWVNNAGLLGHSTFGHLHLLEQVLLELKPDVLLFLIGINDVGQSQARPSDLKNRYSSQSLLHKAIASSEALSTSLVLYRSARARRMGLQHIQIDLNELEILELSDEDRRKELQRHTATTSAFRSRVERLVELSRERGIQPVLITQPALYGDGIDPATGVLLGNRNCFQNRDGKLRKEVLKLYNDTTRSVAQSTDTPLIDAAQKMPKDSSLYYDWMHLSDRGADLLAHIVATELAEVLEQRFVSSSADDPNRPASD